MALDLNQIIALGVEPIPGDSPAGVNIQDDGDYEAAERTFMGLTSLDHGTKDMKPLGGGSAPTWESLAEQSIKILRGRSKHLRVACFLTISSFQLSEFAGLAAGLKMIEGLLANFWETMYPGLKLIKGRGSALEYMATYIAGEADMPGGLLDIKGKKLLDQWLDALRQNPSKSEFEARYEDLKTNFESIVAAQKSMEAMRDRIYAVFPQDKIPSLSSLNSVLSNLFYGFEEEVNKHAKKPEPEPVAAPPPSAAGQQSAPRTTTTQAAAAPMPSMGNDPAQIYAALAKVGPKLQEADPSNPAGYRLLRMGIWGEVTESPSIKEGRTTRVPAGGVNKILIDSMIGMMASSNWMNLLKQAEEMVPNSPLWLDLQFYVFRSLKGMGPAFEAAGRAVSDELANLLKRVPGLHELTFDGGIPFAAPATQQWIETDVLAASSGGGGGGHSTNGGASDGELDEAMNKARTLAGEGQLGDALKLLQSGPSRTATLRERFQWRMALAQVAQESGNAKVTLPIWQSLYEDIDRYNLENWEPQLCVPVLKALYRLCKSEEDQAAQAAAIFNRLCRIDIGVAMSLEQR